MFMIKKTICQCNYYWNDKYKIWEGLRENATQFFTRESAAEYIIKYTSYKNLGLQDAVIV